MSAMSRDSCSEPEVNRPIVLAAGECIALAATIAGAENLVPLPSGEVRRDPWLLLASPGPDIGGKALALGGLTLFYTCSEEPRLVSRIYVDARLRVWRDPKWRSRRVNDIEIIDAWSLTVETLSATPLARLQGPAWSPRGVSWALDEDGNAEVRPAGIECLPPYARRPA